MKWSVKQGATRIAFLFCDRYVLKIPQLRSWSLFLSGLLGNMQEREFSAMHLSELCPVKTSCPLGFWLVMVYAEPLSDEEWGSFDYEAFAHKKEYFIPAENKRSSFGKVKGKIVAVDYGS